MDHRKQVAYFAFCATSLVLNFAGCASWRQWDRRVEFRQQLRCGMNPDKVHEVAQRLGVKVWSCGNATSTEMNCSFREGSTRFLLDFKKESLTAVEEHMWDGLTGARVQYHADLCNGALSNSSLRPTSARHRLVLLHAPRVGRSG